MTHFTRSIQTAQRGVHQAKRSCPSNPGTVVITIPVSQSLSGTKKSAKTLEEKEGRKRGRKEGPAMDEDGGIVSFKMQSLLIDGLKELKEGFRIVWDAVIRPSEKVELGGNEGFTLPFYPHFPHHKAVVWILRKQVDTKRPKRFRSFFWPISKRLCLLFSFFLSALIDES